MAREQRKVSKNWFGFVDKLYAKKYRDSVISDLAKNPFLENQIKEFKESFIEFASLERMNFLPDIHLEVEDYFNRKRMYQKDVKGWYKIINYVFKRDNYTCQYCGSVGKKLEADHIIPFSKGGSDNVENLTTSCIRCNRQKKDKSVDDFIKWKNKNS
jgi:hypothetical protein